MAAGSGSNVGGAGWLLAAIPVWSMLCTAVTAGEVSVQVRDGDGQPVEDVAVVVRALGGDTAGAAAPGEAVVDQVDQEFVPSAIVVPAHTRVLFPNHDDIRHHVYSFSEAKSFELALYSGEPARPIAFPEPGVVTIGCNIHDWMRAHIYVVDAPWHGLTDGDGAWQAAGLPTGNYRVEVWHHGLVAERQPVAEFDLDDGAVAAFEAVVEIEAAPVPRRSPRPGRYRRYP